MNRCIGVAGLPPCGRLIPDSDVNAVDTGEGMIGSCCISRLFPAIRPTPPRGAHLTLKKKAGKVSASVDGNRFRIRPASNRRRVGIRLPGSKDFETEDRGVKKKRRQPWQMERN